MLGRGVKRKWSCLEELEAEVVPSAAAAAEEEEEEEEEDELAVGPSQSEMSHLQQRQLVLGLCLEKLQRYQAGMELSLRRSVLLVNTLRQLQGDVRGDAVHPDPRLLRDDFGGDVPVTCPGCSEGDGPPPPSPEFPPQEVGAAQPDPPVNAVGYLGDLALDDIFEDIDTSMYESSDLPSAWASGSLWPVSVSLWAEEDVKVRPPPPPLPPLPPPSGHGSPGSLQSCLMDLNELDHIMEILVKA